MTTIVIISDLHSGSVYGLTPPEYFIPHYTKIMREGWNQYCEIARKWLCPDVLIVNGDCIEGRQDKQGGAELTTPNRNIQCNMAADAINVWKAKKIYMTYGCLTAGHRILTTDLRWVPVETLKVGDTIAGFEEEPRGKFKRRWVESKVLANTPFEAEVYKIKISDGTYLEATENHPFLVKSGRKYHWKTVRQLIKSIGMNGRGWTHFNRILPVWDINKTYEGGYLSGFFDGEGSCSQRLKENRSGWQERSFTVSATQKNNIMLATVKKYFSDMGIKIRLEARYRDKDLFNLFIHGGIAHNLKFLGSIRPPRLINKFDFSKLGSIRTSYKEKTKIISIEPIGRKIVWGLSTSSKTYVSEGFLSHNTAYHASSQAEDFEYTIAQKLGAVIEGRLYLNIEGVVFDIRHKIGTSTIPHGRATALLKEIMWDLIEQANEVGPKVKVIVRSHAHYHIWIETADQIAFITPGLQLKRGRFGSRECSGEIHWGAIRLTVDKGAVVCKEKDILKLNANRPKVLKV